MLFYYFEEKNRICSTQKSYWVKCLKPAIGIFIRSICLPVSMVACLCCCQSQVFFLATQTSINVIMRIHIHDVQKWFWGQLSLTLISASWDQLSGHSAGNAKVSRTWNPSHWIYICFLCLKILLFCTVVCGLRKWIIHIIVCTILDLNNKNKRLKIL